ncbi:TIGR01244 family sulfur transferase [Pseudogemmobacter humi]|uniref:Beta-lactamase hydrolase-like protein n=1 Tax=Pseudogemmobacter humi TaxID=2483812 RepID=A0A3P5WWM8_9RHOB|nr:TIGR01244 family sulfur transferase [Pseudogemmobacter humi]VDC23451.1 Beta-lactamase hydrolase-like protein [Pseudogemmobacter humi]
MWPFSKRPAWRRLDESFSAGGQVRAADLPAIREAGFSMLLCLRPDGEDPGQPAFAVIADEAARLGLSAFHIPVSGMPGAQELAAFRAVMAGARGSVLGWCRSGARAEALWRLSRG